jgi:hypothetical protein
VARREPIEVLDQVWIEQRHADQHTGSGLEVSIHLLREGNLHAAEHASPLEFDTLTGVYERIRDDDRFGEPPT